MPIAAKEFPMKNKFINVLAAICVAAVGLVGTAWAEEDCIITFNGNGGMFNGNGSIATIDCTALGDADPRLPPSRAGYSFSGWFTATIGGSEVTTSGMGISESINLYAHWTPITYSITCNYDGGTATNQTNYTVESPNIPLNNPTKTGYTFAGWTGDGTGINVSIPTGSIGNKTYTATWKLAYTVSFDLNGGSGDAPRSISIAENETILIEQKPSVTDITKEGYVNDGEWYTIRPETYNNITVAMRDSYGDGWNGNALRISVNGTNLSSSATISASSSSGTYTFNVKTDDVVMFYWVLGSSSNTYPYENAFAVYYTNNPPNPAFNPSSGSSNDDTRILLSKQYSGLSSTSSGTLLGSFTVPAPTKFIFGTGGTPVTSNTTLYLKWVQSYTITFDANYDGGGAPTTKKTDALGKVALPPAPARLGYTFKGWYMGDTKITENTIFSANQTVYARWQLNHTVKFSLNGGSGDAPGDIEVEDEATIATSQKPSTAEFTKNGNSNDGKWYMLTGTAIPKTIFTETFESGTGDWFFVNGEQKNKWVRSSYATPRSGSYSAYISKNGSENLYDTIAASIVHLYKDITFPESNSDFTLRFYFKGVGEANDWMTIRYSETSSTPVAGSKFTDGMQIGTYYSSTPYWTQETIQLPAAVFGGKTMRLVFTWENDDGQSPGMDGQMPAAIDDITITGLLPEEGFSYTEFVFGETVVTSDITLYLKWAPAYTITFNPNGGSVSPLFGFTVGGVIASLPSPVRTGYIPKGWFTAAKGGEQIIEGSTEFTSDSTIYAQWLKDTPILPQIAIRNQIAQTKNGISLVAKTDAVIEVYNLGGKLISKQSYIAGNHTISLATLPKGIYIAKARFAGIGASATTEENLRLVIR